MGVQRWGGQAPTGIKTCEKLYQLSTVPACAVDDNLHIEHSVQEHAAEHAVPKPATVLRCCP
jgi:hypothetical protein